MDIYMIFSEYKNIVKMMDRTEANIETITNDSFIEVYAQMVEYEDSEGTRKRIPIVIDSKFKTPVVIKSTDGNLYIVIGDLNHIVVSNVMAILAHEVGHILSGHFDTNKESYITANKDKQDLYLAKYRKDEKEVDYKLLNRAIFFGILKNGMLSHELEADMKALEYVSVKDLIKLHSSYLDEGTIVTKMEKVNRIAYLSKLIDPVTFKYIRIVDK